MCPWQCQHRNRKTNLLGKWFQRVEHSVHTLGGFKWLLDHNFLPTLNSSFFFSFHPVLVLPTKSLQHIHAHKSISKSPCWASDKIIFIDFLKSSHFGAKTEAIAKRRKLLPSRNWQMQLLMVFRC